MIFRLCEFLALPSCSPYPLKITMHYSLYALAAVVAIVLYLSLIPYQRRRKAQQLGCVEAPLVDFGFLGYNNIKNMMRSADDRTFPEALVKRHFAVAQQEGRELMTWRYSLLGPQNIHTSDPKNMQAMLTTQFDDFSQGRMKRAIFEPLLGPGIFSQDGKAWEHSRGMLRVSLICVTTTTRADIFSSRVSHGIKSVTCRGWKCMFKTS